MVKMGTVWDRAIEFLSDHVAIVIPIALLAIFVPSSITGSLSPLWATAGSGLKALLAMLSLVFAILGVWGQLAISALAIDPAAGRGAGRVATARLLSAIGVYLVVAIVLGLLLLPIGFILAASGVDVTQLRIGANPASLPAGVAGTVTLYVVVLLIVLLFLGARLVLATPVIVAERRGLGAIARAFALSRGLTWKLVGVILLYVVVANVASLAAQSVFGSILGLLSRGEGPVTMASVIAAIAVAAVQAAFTVLATAFVAKLYVAVVHERESAAAVPLDSEPA
ncbi:hypothetical protein [Sphingomonas sp. DT-204]|uniref:hypothetical protein n=1 Tax=Sphingomonas sp. DT-204 TaxID=3396166 RepID=UPI003F1E293D